MATKLLAWSSAAALAVGAISAFGDSCATYRAALGTLPDAQGWSLGAFGENNSLVVVDGVMHQSTMPFAFATCPGPPREQQYAYWQITRPFDFADGAVFEAELKVIACEYGINPCPCCLWARPGLAFAVQDDAGRFFWVGIGESKVFLANDPFLAFGHPGIVEAPFVSTDDFHVYRLEMNGAGAVLTIDGATILSKGFGPSQPGGATAYLGDPTSWSNSAFEVRHFSFEAGPLPSPDINGDGQVNGAEIALILGQWGPCACCAEDLDGDGQVGGSDITVILGAWTG